MLSYNETLAEITGVDCDYQKFIEIACKGVLRGYSEIDDITHNVLTEIVMELLEKRKNGLWRAIEQAKESENPPSNMLKAIRSAARFRARRSPKRLGKDVNVSSEDTNIFENMFVSDETALKELMVQERDQFIGQAVKQLNERHRQCVVLFYYEKMSIAEIAGVMRLPEGTVKRRIHSARVILKEALNEIAS